MTSKRSVIANKKNALRSTGPRTSNGKKRASANALKHGLAANVHHDVAMSARVNELAGVFAGDTTDPHQIENAQIAAEAEIQIQRVRAARVTLIELAAVRPLASVAIEDTGGPPDGAMRGATAFTQALPQLEKLDRYERRALSRRKHALRTLA